MTATGVRQGGNSDFYRAVTVGETVGVGEWVRPFAWRAIVHALIALGSRCNDWECHSQRFGILIYAHMHAAFQNSTVLIKMSPV